ncbi:RNA-directed DNA polymerase, eukaryota [Tanacetum coccineum]
MIYLIFCLHSSSRMNLMKQLHDFKMADSCDILQKAKIKWAIEGDENSKFFHGVVNRKRANLAIKGIMVDGDWVDIPSRVKDEFCSHFASRFQAPCDSRSKINFPFPNRLNSEQATSLETPITTDEIRSAVWACGENKSPGPDGFTFEFFRRFWDVIGPDFCLAVKWFFDHNSFAKGCNSSFIALSENNLISEVQSAFLPKGKFLDGPFLLYNEVCLKRRALDSWQSYLSGKAFCLRSKVGARLLNSTFHYGLKQGDPLAPYLFILVMESLHLSFARIIESGFFKGLNINNTVTVSAPLFYADDAVFVGEWSDSNLSCIMNVLHCFSLASGLKINIHKSHLLGVGVSHATIEAAAASSWKLKSRLSKWKVKNLSIGGWLTLLKSVLGSSPIYQMSIYKVPKAVLASMEALRRRFFYGALDNEKKISWIKWSKILSPKKHGGLGVSSLYALNRALLFKWVWRYISQDNSLWARVISSIHGTKIQDHCLSSSSIWNSIVREVRVLKNHGVDLVSYCVKRVGNGLNTGFWDECWTGDKSLRSMFPRIFALDNNKSCSVYVKISEGLNSSLRRPVRGGVES